MTTAAFIPAASTLKSRPALSRNSKPVETQVGVDVQLFEQTKRELEELRQQLIESDEVVAGLEKERDFYFKKLRKIEVICQENEGTVEIQKFLEVFLFF